MPGAIPVAVASPVALRALRAAVRVVVPAGHRPWWHGNGLIGLQQLAIDNGKVLGHPISQMQPCGPSTICHFEGRAVLLHATAALPAPEPEDAIRQQAALLVDSPKTVEEVHKRLAVQGNPPTSLRDVNISA
eukprot:CAMPEP_0168369692 /NCGR_PEP_ID=MMETSP0228-20121227/6890_1 /TAXON_ID=133427 /ORGANISM="Protoceratium reticulatum, Strain CCCM 535 (=CCMP 1889)" /LENGTH=131 /DNA_ID=CAMNT_0008382563 /DNA_START=445 /DNA_END=840 /DNA_ORIENTATION=+